MIFAVALWRSAGVQSKMCVSIARPPCANLLARKESVVMGSSATQKAATSIIEWGLSNGKVTGNRPKATDIFGSLTFGDEAQRRRLPRDVYRALRRSVTHGEP